MHILVLLQYYHTPDGPTAGRPYALVQALAGHHDVTVITTQTGKERRITHQFEWVPSGVSLKTLQVPYRNAMTTRERLQVYAQYAVRAGWNGLRLSPPDLIVASSTPLSVPMVAGVLARWHGVPWVFEVRDLWPDFPIQMGAVPSSWAQRALYALEQRLYRSAAHIVALSPDMARHVRCRAGHDRVYLNPYGTDLSLLRQAPLQEAKKLCPLDAGQHLVLYAGSLGRANAIPTLLDAARRLRHRSDIVWGFVGSGYHQPTVEAAAARLPNVRMLPPQPYPHTLALFKHASLSITSFIDRPVLRANAPSKLMDSLAAGTPVVVTNPGWTKRLVESGGCGWYVPPENSEALASCVAAAIDAPPERQASWQRNARRLAHTRFDRALHMTRYRTLLESLV
ncbi:glycosyltransferase WbuB [Longimonas halophila]|uniref:Glycosyltransferase WbuB n=1 Tax=Longimonas halophila TaxID=1469170 RepID=A0A2H3NRS7_9BACT|nr:glycosyltransferase family 4 protein [Longimonas halophila]PEN06248.1 glycosyltransferase WbuB [Longimonas halophila]